MENSNTDKIVRAALLLTIAIVFQLIGRNVPEINQFLVGPIVNSVLILTTYICGTRWGALTATLTPILAWIVGQLASAMAPFIPFIIVGNIIYVVFFGILKDKKYGMYIGILVGSFVKFAFLSFSASKLVKFFEIGLPKKVLEKLVISMGIPQLITALIGGAIALILIQVLNRRNVI